MDIDAYLNGFGIYELRQIASIAGVCRPTTLKKADLISEIILHAKGEKAAYIKLKSGRPINPPPDETSKYFQIYEIISKETAGTADQSRKTAVHFDGIKQSIIRAHLAALKIVLNIPDTKELLAEINEAIKII